VKLASLFPQYGGSEAKYRIFSNSMKKVPALLLCLLALILTAKAQISVTNAQICHDSSKFLRCYNDGYFYLGFDRGDVKLLRTSDSDFTYDPVNKAITFHLKGNETIQLKLLPKAVLAKNSNDSLQIDSVNEFPQKLAAFHISTEKRHDQRGLLRIDVNGKNFSVEISTAYNKWSWEIYMVHGDRRLVVKHDPLKQNRLANIYLDDDKLKYWVSVSTAFKTKKKVWQLSASYYVDAVTPTSSGNVYRPVPRPKEFVYEYDKKGRLKHGYGKATLKYCSCE
jgi:hypothetical protein